MPLHISHRPAEIAAFVVLSAGGQHIAPADVDGHRLAPGNLFGIGPVLCILDGRKPEGLPERMVDTLDAVSRAFEGQPLPDQLILGAGVEEVIHIRRLRFCQVLLVKPPDVGVRAGLLEPVGQGRCALLAGRPLQSVLFKVSPGVDQGKPRFPEGKYAGQFHSWSQN